MSALAREEKLRWSEGALEPFLLLVMVIPRVASSGRVLGGSGPSEEDSEIDPISDPSDLVTIAASSESSRRVFIGTLIVELWGRAGIG